MRDDIIAALPIAVVVVILIAAGIRPGEINGYSQSMKDDIDANAFKWDPPNDDKNLRDELEAVKKQLVVAQESIKVLEYAVMAKQDVIDTLNDQLDAADDCILSLRDRR